MSHATTFERLQQLNDSQFHALCDSLLSSIEPRYRLLTPFGRNVRGQSVRGQPDSYVGPSPADCDIAFQYSIQKAGWQQKAIDDLVSAKQSCAKATEFVFATPVDVDRAKQKSGSPDWATAAKTAVGGSETRLFGGRLLAQILDEQRQDIRYAHLGIPCSRLSAEAILVRCQKVNADGIARLKEQERYNPAEYVIRGADSNLLQFWNRCADCSDKQNPYRLIPLVGDSGIGKTSLVARFVEATSNCWPILLIQARDVGFTSADSLVRHAVQLVEGVLSEDAKRTEEAAITHALSGNQSFTVVLDGLDEATDPIAVRQAITFWLSSSLGERSTLVTTSRPEFWQRCVESSWRKHIIAPESVERLEPKRPTESVSSEADRLFGLSITSSFSNWELQQAGQRAGFPGDPFIGFDEQFRAELRHPFTFHVAIQLLRSGLLASQVRTRTDLINIWIDARLKAEASRAHHRMTPEVLRQALVRMAQLARTSNGGWLRVDDLVGLPRFDAAHPPGPAVECLLTAGLLESRQPSGGEVRFAFEAIQDFFAAESDIVSLSEASLSEVVNVFACRSFTESEWQLERMGRHFGSHPLRDKFAQMLLEKDGFKTAALVRGAPDTFSPDVFSRVVEVLCGELKSPIRVQRSKAAEMLRWFNYPSVTTLFPARLLPIEEYSEAELMILTESILRLSLTKCAPIILKCRWFTRGQFFVDIRCMFQNASAEFRSNLAEHAVREISRAGRDSDEYAALVNVLAYLGDERLVHRIAHNFNSTDDLHWYEVNALIELGTSEAAQLYFKFVSDLAACGKTTDELLNSKGNSKYDRRIWSVLCMELRARRNTLSPDFEDGVVAILDHDNDVKKSVARRLVEKFPSPRLLRQSFDRMKPEKSGWVTFDSKIDAVGRTLDFDSWLEFWEEYKSPNVRCILILAARHVRDTRLELILRKSLENEDLRGAAATALAELGLFRASPDIRSSLANAIAASEDDLHSQSECLSLVCALSRLRDPSAVKLLSIVADSKWGAAIEALGALGEIQTAEASRALLQIASEDGGENTIHALIHHGSCECVQFAVNLARQREDGVHWLLEEGLHNMYFRTWARGKFYNHVETLPVISFVMERAAEINDHDVENLFHWFLNVDADPVRALLRRLAAPEGEQLFPLTDTNRWSKAAMHALAERGDESVVKGAAEQLMRDEWFGHRFREDELENFHSPALIRELIICLGKAMCSIEICRLIRQIGRHGTASDSESIVRFTRSEDPAIANVATEAVVRLTDPRLIPENWP